MNVVLYRNSSPRNKVDKAVSQLASITGYLKDESAVKNPEIEFSLADANNITGCNYAYIPDFNRYYYRGEIVRDNKTLRVKFKEDVLMSWRGELRANTATITRNANTSNGYLIDGNYKANAYRECVTKQFPNAIENDTLILITVG